MHELQARLESVSIQKNKLNLQRIEAVNTYNVQDLNRILQEEEINGYLHTQLAEAIERKVVQAKVP